ncbi:MAG: imidazole glycerol phosphate synthase subunit HisH [Candidatus Omnitrophica bacterium]|nr:imidazole glycerol phosphate synthase subunit HisH [Candidatus Omnitrophota bacterium]
MIAVIDYGMGNLRSVEKALARLGFAVKVTSSKTDIAKAKGLVLPGVGAFGDAMSELKKRDLVKPITDAIHAKKPYLGICLGLQLLFTQSEEKGLHKGFGIIKGSVIRFPEERFRKENRKIPHMGWNQIERSRRHIRSSTKHAAGCPLLEGIPDGGYFYFVHSYYPKPEDDSLILTTTEYGVRFASSVCKANIYATQFHPEKSQALGLRILENFGKLCL